MDDVLWCYDNSLFVDSIFLYYDVALPRSVHRIISIRSLHVIFRDNEVERWNISLS